MAHFSVLVHNIKYDTDGDDINLPKNLTTKVEADDEDDLEEVISNFISNETGFCHFGFEYKILK